jgi:N-acetylmuramic acid 6-phosphate etherase
LSSFQNITESESHYRHLEKMTVKEILFHINEEDKKVPPAVEKALPQIEILIHVIVDRLLSGGRLFYIGAGTSGRLGIVDATECPPTFGVPGNLVNAIIAGGKKAITEAVEYAEDDIEQGWKDLQEYTIMKQDVIIGIAASGTTPYVISALKKCKENNIVTGSISCNLNSPLSEMADHAIEIIVGPEFITGSTRMKSGTAMKLVLNMISTTVMIQLGRIEDNQMVNMQLTNEKLVDRGVHILMQELKLSDYEKARSLLLHYGTVKKTLQEYHP